MATMPDLTVKPKSGASPQRQWIAEVGALVGRVSSERKTEFAISKERLDKFWSNSIDNIQGVALDSIEELKLDLEISGQADIGSAYVPGDVYKFFADLKSIVNGAQSEIFIIDPYFDGDAFDSYLADVSNEIVVRVFANKHAREVKIYIGKHKAQFSSSIEIRKNKKLHDRLVIVDRADCWITGGSINHADKKSPSYLIPIGTELTKEKLRIYDDLWISSSEIT